MTMKRAVKFGLRLPTFALGQATAQLDEMADYLIDLGPEGGEKGGRVVASGTPEEVARFPSSYTGKFLADILSESVA